MDIPQSAAKTKAFLDQVIEQCNVSRSERIDEYRIYRQYVLNGGLQPGVIHNKIYPYVDMLSSSLFSPVDARFSIDYDYTDDAESLDMAVKAARILTRDMQKSNTDSKFGEGVFWGCVYGSTFLQDVWGHNGAEPNIILPSQIGVLREDISELERQEAFNITRYMTAGQFARHVRYHPDRNTLLADISKLAISGRQSENQMTTMADSLIISGVNNAMRQSGTNSNRGGFTLGQANPQIDSKVLADIIQMDETWVFDSNRGDWVTFQTVGPYIIEGKYKRRNLSGVRGETGITQIAPHEMEGYIWARSEIAGVIPIQDEFTGRLTAYNRIAKMRANPARLITGSSTITSKSYEAQNRPGGLLTDSTPTVKHESLAPDMPQEQQYMMSQVDDFFDQAGGFTSAMKGKGESGVRAGDHADTLVRTGSTRLRDKAISVERQYASVGDFRLKLLMAKNATTYRTRTNVMFRLGDLPNDWRVAVDSHSSSPIFSEDNKQLALALKKLGVIGNEDAIKMLHPPMEDEILESIHRREQAEQEQMQQALKQDPSLISKLFGKKR